ncbi:MAG TPA: efflux RND transporter periplasmic adaptor subunit [Gallionellaceae bacterium]|nr:efflux RND transporter periplasmic adaptor subunit [Gallionellaceae bacterium]
MRFGFAGKGDARWLKWGVLLFVVGTVLVVAGFLTRTKPIAVTLAKAERGTVEASVSNTRAGTVKACRRAKMSPPAGGQISQLRVKKGQRVKKGEILLELWHKDLHAQEDLAQEQLATARSHAKEACAVAEVAQRDAERSRQLRAQGFISSQQLDRALTDASARQASCDAARGEIEQSSARIDVARAGLERMTLRAPFSGIVADISGELGEYATPSPPGIPTLPAIDLIDDSCMFVSAPIDEVDAANVKVGQPARITLDAIKGKSFAGKVKRIAPYVLELEKQARTVEVEVEFAERPSEENLLVGYSADVEIMHETRANVLRIPTQAILEGRHVLRYGADGRLEDRVVKTGLSNWEYSEVTDGLKEGDQIVMSLDRPGVKAGAKVLTESVKK